ncbi:MAG: hypothetical protein IKI43_00070 [Campylobacter sp.]|nr:hypothetical protein [Campylobacter sp.]
MIFINLQVEPNLTFTETCDFVALLRWFCDDTSCLLRSISKQPYLARKHS